MHHPAMFALLLTLLGTLRSALRTRAELALENLALLSLGKDAPEGRAVHAPHMGDIVELPEVGGLHRRYIRQAA
jgi:hypothetical protein